MPSSPVESRRTQAARGSRNPPKRLRRFSRERRRNPPASGGGGCQMTPLPEGGTVGVIGAGPAGTFFALHFLTLLKESGRAARVTLFDRKTFECSGPSGCNMCAGAIGGEMVNKIKLLGLTLDERVIRRIADGYEIHGRDISVNVVNPQRGEIYTVFRGGGPVESPGGRRSFAQFLLEAAWGLPTGRFGSSIFWSGLLA